MATILGHFNGMISLAAFSQFFLFLSTVSLVVSAPPRKLSPSTSQDALKS